VLPLVYRPDDPAFLADPFPLYRRLQDDDPAHWSPHLRAWVLTRYEDVKAACLDVQGLSSDRLTPFFAASAEAGRMAALQACLTRWMVFRDPPDHTRLRRLFTKAFTSRSLDALKPNIRAIVDMLLDDMAASEKAGQTVDWVTDFSYVLPAFVIMDLLGVPRVDLKRMKAWSDEIALFIGTSKTSPDKYDRAEAGARAMADYFREIVAQRTREPRDDMISRMVMARDANEAMSADEVIATCILLLFAGHETTANLLGNGLYYALRFRDQWDRLVQDPGLIESAIEEWLRYDGPSGAIARVVLGDINFGGKRMRAGQRVFAFVNSANRDGAQFPDPDRFDIGRTLNPHLTFGHGIHFCLGAPLARLEGQIAAARLAERFPRIALTGDSAPAWSDSLILRGILSLPVRLG